MSGHFLVQADTARDLDLTGDALARDTVITAADSLVARYDPEVRDYPLSFTDLQVGCVRSWDSMRKVGEPDTWRLDNMDEHFLVIIDNMASCTCQLPGRQ